MTGGLFGLFRVEATERYAHLASDRLKEPAVRISESIAEEFLPGYLGLTIGTLGEHGAGVIKADWGIVTLLFPVRIGARPPRAA